MFAARSYRYILSSRTCIRTLTDSCSSKRSEFDPYALFITPKEHADRQRMLASVVSSSIGDQVNKKSLLIIPAARKSFLADTRIPPLHFKQCSDFIYLTGLNTSEAANCVLVIQTDGSSNDFRSLLFVPFRTESEIVWEGCGLKSQEFGERISAMDITIENVKYFESFVNEECEKRHIFTTKDGYLIDDSKGRRRLRPDSDSENMIRKPVTSLTPFIDQLRLIKSPGEMKAMARTCSIGSRALTDTRSFCKELSTRNSKEYNVPLVNESQIAARFDYEVRLNGASKLAYPSVVAGGARSTIIHYGTPDKFVTDDDWILMDAGCEDVEGYNSDITRCWIVGGEANTSQSRLQAALYEALCEVQNHLISHLKERGSSSEAITLDQLFQIMCSLLGKVLVEFGLIPKSSSAVESARAGYKYCPHHVSHYLGLDVHDTPSISRNIPLTPGMCFTVEPGLYFRDADDVKKEFRGIGIRVEDDLLMMQSGEVNVLTANTSWT